MTRMTPAEAAAQLGIPAEHHPAFEVLVDRIRTPNAEQQELARLRAELGKVDDELRKAGIEYPLGARGVHDLAGFVHGTKAWAEEKISTADEKARQAREEAEQSETVLARVRAVAAEWGEPHHCGWMSASVLVRQLRAALDGTEETPR